MCEKQAGERNDGGTSAIAALAHGNGQCSWQLSGNGGWLKAAASAVAISQLIISVSAAGWP